LQGEQGKLRLALHLLHHHPTIEIPTMTSRWPPAMSVQNINDLVLPSRTTMWIDLLCIPVTPCPPRPRGVSWAWGLQLAVVPALVGFLASWLIHIGGVFADNFQLLTRHPGLREHPELCDAIANGTLTRMTPKAAMLSMLYALLLGTGVALSSR
jgi:hypothetical protein